MIKEMLTENTGSHPLDSGFGNGRHWQKNQGRDFENEPPVTYELYQYNDGTYEIDRTVNVYHFLSELETDDVCDEFNNINTNSDNWDADCECYGISKEAWEYLETHHDIEVEHTFNTYNGDSDLSQVLQGSWIRLDGEQYLILQVHNGADVRGGYTDARLFKPYDEWQINPYIMEYMCQDEILDELEYIDKVWIDGKEVKLTEELRCNIREQKQVCTV